MRKPVQSNAEEGYVLARIRSEPVFCSERCKCGTKKQPCTNVVGRPGSKLAQQLGIERTEIFCLYWPHCIFCQWGGGSRDKERKKEREIK